MNFVRPEDSISEIRPGCLSANYTFDVFGKKDRFPKIDFLLHDKLSESFRATAEKRRYKFLVREDCSWNHKNDWCSSNIYVSSLIAL